MRYLTLSEVLDLHRRIIEQFGGADGVRESKVYTSCKVEMVSARRAPITGT